MKYFRALTAVVIAGAMTLSLAACGGSTDTADSADTSAEAEATDEASEDTEAVVTTVEDGQLIWGTNASFPPYESIDNNEVVGIDADIAAELGERLGLEAVVENMDFDAIIPAVTSGKIDVGIAGMTVNEERLVNVNFSTPYVEAGQVIVVPEGSDITSVEDLNGKIIGVQRGTTGDDYVSDAENGIEAAEIQRFSSAVETGQALLSNKIEVIVIDNQPAKSIVNANEGLEILPDPLTSEQYAICVSKDNEALLDAINAALADMEADGTLQAILDEYLVED